MGRASRSPISWTSWPCTARASAATIAPGPAPAVAIPEDAGDPVIPPRKENGEAREAAERRSIRVPAEKIDTLLDLVGETVLHRRRLEHALGGERAVRARRPVSDELDLGERLLDGLKNAAIGLRTLPLSSIMAPLPRAVRDLASATGKEVELVVDGVETELDRAILEGLPEILVHLLRNAIGHGIEAPDERVRLGKPSGGRLEVRAEQRGGLVEITVADDGRGVSEEALAEGRRTGSLADVLASAGFSTASEVDDISGPGGRPRRRQGQGGVVRRGSRGAEHARPRHPGGPAAAPRARAHGGHARRAGRQRVRAPARKRGGGGLAGREALARGAAGHRGARALDAPRGPLGPDGRRRHPARRRAPRSSS